MKLKIKSKKLIRNILIGIGIAVVLLGIAAYALVYPYYMNNIKIVDKPAEIITPVIDPSATNIPDDVQGNIKDDIYKQEKKADEIINIVLCGVDTRSYDENSRSDTIILASYNKTQHKVKLISFMRDTWVELPGRSWNRINAATVLGGTGLLVNTLNHNFDLDIQNYVQIKFDDFRKIIDAIGGIDVELTRAEIKYINRKLHSDDRDWKNDITAEPGLVHLNGAQALWQCRNRSIGNSDFTRTERQREVLAIIIDKLTSMNLGQATRLVFELRGHVNTNVPIETILEIGKDAIITGNIEVESIRIPSDNSFKYANKHGMSVLEIDIARATKEIHEFLGYETTDEADVTEDNELGDSGMSGYTELEEVKGTDKEDQQKN